MNHSLFVRIKMLKVKDFFGFIKFLIALPISFFYRMIKRNIWLICESENEARDNGYWLYKYVCEEQPKVNVVYAINYDSPDFTKVKNMGCTCKYGSIMHWIFYLVAQYNISSQKGGKPNTAICYVLEVYGIINNKRIFLQHGITYNKAEWLFYENTKLRLFICGAKPEYDYVLSEFGYPVDNVKYLGFSRFDNLINTARVNNKKQILVMPTWREWLVSKTQMSANLKYDGNFKTTPYFKNWTALLNDERLIRYLEKNEINLLFFPHRDMQEHLLDFTAKSSLIKLASWKQYDIQDMFINSDLMITDYSSVAFDFAYLYKPVVFFQFDYAQFREGQYKEGYFKFENQLIGSIAYTLEDVIDDIIDKANRNFKISDDAFDYINSFFTLRDNHNCKRIFEAIQELDNGDC